MSNSIESNLLETPNIVIIDNDKARAKGMAAAFMHANCATPIYLWKNGRGKTQCSEAREIPGHSTILLWHIGDLDGDWPEITADQLIYYSGNGGEDARFPAETPERIWRPVKIGLGTLASGVLSQAEAEALLSYVSRKQAGSCDLEKPAVLERLDRALLALGMLCQGYLATYANYDELTNQWEPSAIVDVLQHIGWTDFLNSRQQTSWFEEDTVGRKRAIAASAKWWLNGLGLLDSGGVLDRSAYLAFRAAIKQAWTPSESGMDLLEFLSVLAKPFQMQDATQDSGSLPEVNLTVAPESVVSVCREIFQRPTWPCSAQNCRYSVPEEDFKHILTIRDSSLSTATSTVLALLLNAELHFIDREISPTSLDLEGPALLIISENALDSVSALRLRGFGCAVIALSSDSFEQVKQRYSVMRWGQGSHAVCALTSTVACLLAQLANMYPLEPENLAMLQSQLRAPVSWLDEKVRPLLKALQNNNANDQQLIDELAKIIHNLREITPVVYHTPAEIDGQTLQIQQHFKDKLDNVISAQLSGSAAKGESLALLWQVFERWRDLVLVLGGNLQ